jgi:hypothetical protein
MSFTSGFLFDAAGNPTTVRFQILPHPPGTIGPSGNQAFGYRAGSSTVAGFNTAPNLRFEFAAINNQAATNTMPFMNWLFTGLVPNEAYDLVLFGGAKETPNDNILVTMLGNGIPGVRDTEGDFNWSGLADASGQIAINISLPQPNTGSAQSRYFGFQIQSATVVVPEPAAALLAACGFAALGLRRRAARR